MPKKNNAPVLSVVSIERFSAAKVEVQDQLAALKDYLARYYGYLDVLGVDAVLRLPEHRLKELNGWARGLMKKCSMLQVAAGELDIIASALTSVNK